MMVAMRAVLFLLVLALVGCAGPGYLMALRQDKEDRAAVARVLARQPTGRPFPARAMLAKPWTRLWVFGDRATAQGIEDRIGLPFPRTEQPVARGATYLVFTDAEQVLSAFTLPPGPRGTVACMGSLRPLGAGTSLVLAVGTPRRLTARGRENVC
jgi:hypothetical protein